MENINKAKNRIRRDMVRKNEKTERRGTIVEKRFVKT